MTLLSFVKAIFPRISKVDTSGHTTDIAKTLDAPIIRKHVDDKQDQFSFLYENFDNYREGDRHIDADSARMITSKILDNGEYLYRGMGLTIDELRNIYNTEGMLKGKVNYDDEEEDEKVICFCDRYNAYMTIGYTSQDDDQLSFIFEIPEKLMKSYNIPINGSGDVMRITKDIPPEIIQQCNVFVVDYKNQTLVKIPPIQ